MISPVNLSIPPDESDNTLIINSENIDKIKFQFENDAKSSRTKYSKQFKDVAHAMHQAGYSYRSIRAILDIPSLATVHAWCHMEIDANSPAIELSEQIKNRLAAKQYRNAEIFTEAAIDPKKLDKASTLQLATSGGISIQRGLELEGKAPPAFNINVTNNNIEKAQGSLQALDSTIMDVDAEITRLQDQ